MSDTIFERFSWGTDHLKRHQRESYEKELLHIVELYLGPEMWNSIPAWDKFERRYKRNGIGFDMCGFLNWLEEDRRAVGKEDNE